MATDDELLDQLAAALLPEGRQPPADRIASLRAAAAAARAATPHVADRVTSIATARSRRTLPLAVLLAAVAAAIAFVLGGIVADDTPPVDSLTAGGVREFETMLEAPVGTASASVKGIRTGIGRIVQLRSSDLPILPKGEFYEVWFVGAGDSPAAPNRISAGTFHPDSEGRSDVDLTAAVDPALYPQLAVTAEPGDGNPAPDGPDVLRARIEVLGTP